MLSYLELLSDTFEEFEGELLIDIWNTIEKLVEKFLGAQIKDSADFNDDKDQKCVLLHESCRTLSHCVLCSSPHCMTVLE